MEGSIVDWTGDESELRLLYRNFADGSAEGPGEISVLALWRAKGQGGQQLSITIVKRGHVTQ